ncbi:MAG: hypothetical protein JW793_02640 [Acidobacteria bacterium]|nr:hypothetical protein [Acidobacteriota bacterium]
MTNPEGIEWWVPDIIGTSGAKQIGVGVGIVAFEIGKPRSTVIEIPIPIPTAIPTLRIHRSPGTFNPFSLQPKRSRNAL